MLLFYYNEKKYEYYSRIIAVIWSASFYRLTVNESTTSEGLFNMDFNPVWNFSLVEVIIRDFLISWRCTMQSLIDKIKTEGRVVSDGVLKVDSFLNHQVDPKLTFEMGKEFASYFHNKKITKVLTLESSGIPPALTTAMELGVPMVFAKKQKPMTMNKDVWVERVFSFTKQIENEIHIGKAFLSANDRVLIIDDFLAHGEAALGLASIVKQAGARVVGIGIVIEKSFQDGGKKLKDAGYDVYSLARIKNLSKHQIEFITE